MKKVLLLVSAVLLSVSSYGQNKPEYKPLNATIGGISGFTTNENYPSMIFGGWVNFGKVGIEFKRGVILNQDVPKNYFNGNMETYIISSSFKNVGVFVPVIGINNNKDANVFVSAGGQFSENITTTGIKKTQNPYVGFGIDFSFGVENRAVIRTELQFSKISTVGMGLGYKF